tara:strand:- start:12802 stop:14214 length:1413 start_codon:yes stop_codon:yes gene_type:complete
MALNTTTNLILNVTARSANSSLGITNLVVPQRLKVNSKQLTYGSTVIENGHITINNTTTSTTPVITNSGTFKEITTFTISSIVPYKQNAIIATIRIIPDSTFKIVKKANTVITSSTSGAKVYLKETSTENLYNLICRIDESTIDNFSCDLNYFSSRTTTAAVNDISRVSFGSSVINAIGKSKEIKVYGKPNASFKICVLDYSNKSIVSNPNSTDVTPLGVKSCFSGNLNRVGYYTFGQKFPGIPTIITTAINGSMAASGATQITFDSLTNVLVGDQIFILGTDSKAINNGDTVKVVSIDSTYVCTLSASITAPDNTPVKFKRAASYKINISTTGILSGSIPTGFPTYTLNQYLKPLLTITATTATSGVRINGATALAVDSQSVTGNYLRGKGFYEVALTYILTGKTFALTSGHPIASDWTTTSGDTTIFVYGFRVTGAGTTTCTIFANLQVVKWGVEDTVVNLNIDNVIS